MEWLDVETSWFPRVCELSREHRLRSADAGHLLCFQQAAMVLPDLVLVCFYVEMVSAAKREDLTVWAGR